MEHIILAGDEVILPLLREHFTPLINERVIDVLRLDITTPENEVLAATLEAMRQHDAKTDAEKVDRMLGEYRGGGLAVVGGDDVLKALTVGQVDELLLSATLDTVLRNDTTEEAGGADPGTSPGGQARCRLPAARCRSTTWSRSRVRRRRASRSSKIRHCWRMSAALAHCGASGSRDQQRHDRGRHSHSYGAIT